MIKTLLALLLLGSFKAFSCEVQKLESINLAVAAEESSVIAYRADRVLQELPYFRVTNCSQTALAGSFLMLAFGPEITNFDDSIKGINFNRSFGYKRCELSGTPYGTEASYENRLAHFNDSWKLIDSCLTIEVEDEGPQPLSFPEKQPGCTPNRLSNQKMQFNGGYCFLKPNFGSSYLIKIKVNEKCQSIQGLSALGIHTLDLYGAINAYIAGDASGQSSQLKALSNLPIRFSINPIATLIRPSDNFGLIYPTWPEDWPIPDVHLARPTLNNPENGNIQLHTPLLVNNNCASLCQDNFCQSLCSYAQPVVGEFSLYVVNGEKPELISTWLNGGIAPAHFQGNVTGLDFEIPRSYLEQGKKYLLEVIINEPQYDFERFKKRIKNRLNSIDQQLGSISRSTIPVIQEIPGINQGGTIPNLPTINTLVFDQNLNGISGAVEALRAYLNFKLWPPYFARSCFQSSCRTLGPELVRLRSSFEIGEEDKEKKELGFKVLTVERSSTLLPSYTRNSFFDTEVVCRNMEKESK